MLRHLLSVPPSPTLRRAAAISALVAAPFLIPSAAEADSVRLASPAEGACTDPAGVTVVVDASGLDGALSIACAPGAPATGTAALEAAGFATARDASGYLCAVGGLPDPCPTEFTGEYWSYWYVEDGAWASYQEGSDTAVPVPGGAEGWAWGDGSTPPGVDAASVVFGAEPAESPTPSADPTADAASPEPSADATLDAADTAPAQASDAGVPWPAIVGAAALVPAAGLVILVARRRRQQAG